MNDHLSPSSAHDKGRGLLKTFGKIVLRIVGAGLVLLFGFWLLLASNTGPAYLPHIIDGALDFWIRMVFLGMGLGIWLITAVWIIWLMLSYYEHLIKRRQ